MRFPADDIAARYFFCRLSASDFVWALAAEICGRDILTSSYWNLQRWSNTQRGYSNKSISIAIIVRSIKVSSYLLHVELENERFKK